MKYIDKDNFILLSSGILDTPSTPEPFVENNRTLSKEYISPTKDTNQDSASRNDCVNVNVVAPGSTNPCVIDKIYNSSGVDSVIITVLLAAIGVTILNARSYRDER